MINPGWIFLYTPIPWLAFMFLVAYRHDNIGRLVRPFHDHSSLLEWWSVSQHLGLIEAGAKKPESRWWRPRTSFLLVISILVSLLWLPTALPWYGLCLLQIAAAVPSFVLVFMWSGPLPYKPYRDVLPYPRQGTRVRHLGSVEDPRGR